MQGTSGGGQMRMLARADTAPAGLFSGFLHCTEVRAADEEAAENEEEIYAGPAEPVDDCVDRAQKAGLRALRVWRVKAENHQNRHAPEHVELTDSRCTAWLMRRFAATA